MGHAAVRAAVFFGVAITKPQPVGWHIQPSRQRAELFLCGYGFTLQPFAGRMDGDGMTLKTPIELSRQLRRAVWRVLGVS
jgi:hypothetical protein